MRKLFALCAIMVALYAACCKVNLNDSELRERFDELENRVEKLEEFCAQMNTNIDALQTVVTALQEQDYVTGVAPIMQGEKEIGYTITFAKASPVTIYQQESLPIPAIGVKQNDDGVYYWTLDGEWLTDEEGNPLRVEGKDGADGADGKDGENATDGITPQLRITEGYWEISYDGGESWALAGKATGEDGENGADGEPGGDSIFKSVTQDESNVTFRLQSGEEIVLPKKSALSITFSEEMPLVFKIGETKRISYTVTGGNEKNVVLVEMLFDDDGGYTLQFEPSSANSGQIVISANIPSANRVIVTVSDGSNTIMVPIDLEMRPVMGKDTVTVVTPGTLATLLREYEPTSITQLTVIGNPNEADIKTLSQLPNLAKLDLRATNIKVIPQYAFWTKHSLTSIVLPEGLEVIGTRAFYQSSLSGELVIPESVTSIGEWAFMGCSGLTGELKIPEGVIEIGPAAFGSCGFTGELVIPKSVTSIYGFSNCSGFTGDLIIPGNVKSVGGFGGCTGFARNLIISEGVTIIDNSAFSGCYNLIGNLVIPKSVTSIGDNAFYKCSGFTGELVIPEGVTSISNGAFHQCSGFTGGLVIPKGVTSIGDDAFRTCSGLSGNLVISEGVTSIGNQAFSGCNFTGNLIIPESVKSIGSNAFYSYPTTITDIYCKSTTPFRIEVNSFGSAKKLYVPRGCAEKYRTADVWNRITWEEIIETDF